MTIQTQDRRRDRRVTAKSPLTLRAPDGSIPATLRNISMAGVSCTSGRKFEEMTKLQIDVSLPGADGAAEEISVEGAVVRCEPLRRGTARRRYELAVYFLNLDSKTRDVLSRFIRSRLSQAD